MHVTESPPRKAAAEQNTQQTSLKLQHVYFIVRPHPHKYVAYDEMSVTASQVMSIIWHAMSDAV